RGMYYTEWANMMAGGTITLTPILIVFLFTPQYFVRGVVLSGLKGWKGHLKRNRMNQVPFFFTNDDIGGQEPERFAQLLDFLHEQEVPATFFTIPLHGGKPLDSKPEWMALVERALAEGHDLEHHAYSHNSCFEFGVPPYFMLDIMPEARDKFIDEPI